MISIRSAIYIYIIDNYEDTDCIFITGDLNGTLISTTKSPHSKLR